MNHYLTQDNFASPADLVDEIASLWDDMAATGTPCPPLPSRRVLRRLLEVAFWASLVTEEGRPVSFTLCCTPVTETVRRTAEGADVEIWAFDGDRPYDVAELRRLAVATTVNSAALWVQFTEDEEPLHVRGLLNLGLSWLTARMGLSEGPEPFPDALVIQVEGPGLLTVLLHQVPVLGLYGGTVQRPRTMVLPLGGLPASFSEGIDLLLARLIDRCDVPTDIAREVLQRTYVQILRTIVNGIRERRHGGALLIISPESAALDPARALIRSRYPAAPHSARLAEHVLNSVDARLRLQSSTGHHALYHDEDEATGLELRSASLRLVEAANFIAGLSGTDGAIALRSDLTLVGFGTEIAVAPRLPGTVVDLSVGTENGPRRVSAEQYGMRHRSALWLCASAPDVSAFVVSQDGGVSFVFNREGQAYMLPNVETLLFAGESLFGDH